MKLLIGAAAFAAAGLVSASPAAAEMYYSLGYGFETIGLSHLSDYTVTPPDVVKDAGVPLVTARVGWNSGLWYGVEGELSMGLGAGDPVTNSANVGIRHSAAVYGVATYPVMEGLSLHARAGVAYQTSKMSNSGQPIISNETGLSYGVGASYTVNTDLTLRFDYTKTDIDFTYVVDTTTTPPTTVSSKGADTLHISVVKTF